jgi:hypothetical protein
MKYYIHRYKHIKIIYKVYHTLVTYLIHREYIKNKEMKETKFREKLLMRRTGISGRSGGSVKEGIRQDKEKEKKKSLLSVVSQ